MDFFKQKQEAPSGPDPLAAATAEMEMYTDLFNKLSKTCFEKCMSRRHRDEDLTLGEMGCTDRCVAKFLEAQEKVGIILQKANAAQAEQQQKLQQMQNQFGA